MPRVKIKCRGQATRVRKTKLLEILCTKEIHITKIFDTNDGFAVLTLNEDHADTIFNREVREDLESNGYQPIMPPELKVKKSVIITKVDDIIFDWSIEEIADELILKNEWIGEELDSVFKFPNTPTIKITFTQTTLAKKCTEKGLRAFNLSIPPREIRQETFTPIRSCMKCYKLEDHNTRECPEDKEFKICSECSTPGHLWFQCREETKKCINCGEAHSTLAMKCKLRKSIIKEKRKQETERTRMTFSEATRISGTQYITNHQKLAPQPVLSREDLLKVNICVTHAHFKNKENPGTYAEELNKVLTANNLPNIIIPDDPVTHTSVGATSLQQHIVTDTTQYTDTVTPQHTGIDKTHVPQGGKDSMEPEREAKEIGLQLYTIKERGWPKNNFSTEDLLNCIQHNTYKWTYININYTEDQVLQLIKKGSIKLKDCWNTIDKDAFRKIRSGLIQDRSPLVQRDLRLRKQSR